MTGRYRGEICVISLGGNAILRRNEKGTVEEQFEHTRACAAQISKFLEEGQNLVITHGNGPIVGNIVIQNEAAKNIVPPSPLYICDADSEGGIGFMIQQTLYNCLRKMHAPREVVTLITQVVVDGDDPAFANPTKPIGPYYEKAAASILEEEKNWSFIELSRTEFRRVVPSPKPKRIVEVDVIRKLAEAGVVVIAVGGGGVPVVEGPEGDLAGIDGVVDKDLATGVLAGKLEAKRILNLTQVDRVYLNYGTDAQVGLDEVSLDEIKKHYADGHFPPGSMGPKVEAAIDFLEAGGHEVIITQPELASRAMAGMAGTRIYQ